jgi:small subunit ribosomal protein S19
MKKLKKINLFNNNKILPLFLNKKINVYNGKNYSELVITKNMIGYKIGEFVFTKSKKKI